MAEVEGAVATSPRDRTALRSDTARRPRWPGPLWALRHTGFVLRYLWWFKVRQRHVRTGGVVFLARGAEIRCRKGLGHMEFGRGVWVGRGTAIRCHEGFLRVGDDVVFGAGVTVNGYLDVDIGDDCLLADGVYVGDFDHRFEDLSVPIHEQGIVAAPVRIGRDCRLGHRSTVGRGVRLGDGSVIGALSAVTRDVPPGSVAVGAPARVVRRRG